MTLKELLMVTNSSITIITDKPSLFSDNTALIIKDHLFATDGIFNDKFLESEIVSLSVNSNGNLCVKLNWELEEEL